MDIDSLIRLIDLEDIAPYIAQAGFYEEAVILGKVNRYLRNDERLWRFICKSVYNRTLPLGFFKRTNLAFYAKLGNIERVRFLLDHGAIKYINWRDSFGRTPLYEAIEGAYTEVIDELVARGGIANSIFEGKMSCKIESDAIDDEIWSLTALSNTRVAIGMMLGHIIIRDITDPSKTIAKLEGHVDEVKALITISDHCIASAGRDNSVRVWSIKPTQTVLPSRKTVKIEKQDVWICEKHLIGHTACVWSLALLANGNLASGGSDTTVRIWDLVSGTQISLLQHTSSILALTSTPSGLAVGCGDGSIHLWNLDYVKVAQFGNLRYGPVCCLTMIPDGRCVAGYSDSNVLSILDIKKYCVDLELIGHTDCVYVLGVLSDGRIISGSRDCTIKIWNIFNNTNTTLEDHTGVVLSLSRFPDGSVITGDDQGTLILWK
jgi:WD40 repeat protein